MSAPQPFRYEGDGTMQALRPRAADREYVVGETYTLVAEEPRSSAQHRMFFASVNECWKNLPDSMAEQYPDAETLRKKALIRCGYCDERSIVCSSKAEARRMAAFIEPMDRYAIVAVSGSVVTVWTPKSQSVRAMGKVQFAESVEKVLAFCADLIGVTPDELKRAEAA